MGGPGHDDFYTMLLGGAWTKIHKKKAVDCMVAKARGGDPRRFVKMYSMGVLHSFALNKYGEEACALLALETARRLQHFYDIYVFAEDDPFTFSEEELVSCPEDEAFITWLLTIDAMSPTWERAQKVRVLKPSPPALDDDG